MQDEFPMLEHRDYQNEFLKDWWTPKKLFKGKRQCGKTTLLQAELKRFEDHDFDTIIVTPTINTANYFVKEYQNAFGERPTAETVTYDRFEEETRGRQFDAVIMDRFGQTTFDKISPSMSMLNPLFVRAAVDKSDIHNVHYLEDEDGTGYFDSVYEV
jgi:hypothetical protein